MYAVPTVSHTPPLYACAPLLPHKQKKVSAVGYLPPSQLTINSVVFIMCIPWCCWPFVDVELEEPPKKQEAKKEEEDKRYIMVEDGSLFYPVS